MFNNVFTKIVPFINVEKYCRAGRATDDSMAHAVCVLDTKGYTLTQNM